MDEMKGRGKRGLLRVVFGRTMFFLLFIALQLAFFFWIYVWLDNKYQAWGYGSFALISAILTIHILNEKQNASFKMAWLIPVLLFPVFGTLFFEAAVEWILKASDDEVKDYCEKNLKK